MLTAIIYLSISTTLGMIIPGYVANGSSESELNRYERGFRDGEKYPFNQNAYVLCGK